MEHENGLTILVRGSRRRAIEFRTEPRLSTFEEARVMGGKGEWARSCVLADVSQTGACLRLVGAADLPAEIALYLPRSMQWTRARLVWRRATACGVEFLRPLVPRTNEAEAPQRK